MLTTQPNLDTDMLNLVHQHGPEATTKAFCSALKVYADFANHVVDQLNNGALETQPIAPGVNHKDDLVSELRKRATAGEDRTALFNEFAQRGLTKSRHYFNKLVRGDARAGQTKRRAK